MLGFSHPRIPSKEAHDGTCTRIHGACARTLLDDDRADVRQSDDRAYRLGVRRSADSDANDPGCGVGGCFAGDDVYFAAKSAVAQVGSTCKQFTDQLGAMLIPRKITEISHNKFIVLLKDGKPEQVW